MGCAASNSRSLGQGALINTTAFPMPFAPNSPSWPGVRGDTEHHHHRTFYDYASPPPPYAEVAPSGHTTLRVAAHHLGPKATEDDPVDVSVCARSSISSGGGTSFLDSTAVSIDCASETAFGEASGLFPLGGEGGTGLEVLPGRYSTAERPLVLTQSCTSSAIRRSRSASGPATPAQSLPFPSDSGVNHHASTHRRTRHPSLPHFTVSPIAMDCQAELIMQLEPLNVAWVQPQGASMTEPSQQELVSSLCEGEINAPCPGNTFRLQSHLSPTSESRMAERDTLQPHPRHALPLAGPFQPLPPLRLSTTRTDSSQFVSQLTLPAEIKTYKKKKKHRRKHAQVSTNPNNNTIASTTEVI